MKAINVGNTIAKKRKEKGITQEELATYIGISKASVSKWETGQSYPDIVFLPELATYFNISLDTLLGYTPQMNKEDIKKIYFKLAKAFASKPFEDVFRECEEIIKKYYSCFPLLLQMSVLLLNHHNLVASKERQHQVIQQIILLCQRIRSESDEVYVLRLATTIEAICESSLGSPQNTLALLGETLNPYMGEDIILANAYQLLGKIDKAKEMYQVSMYQSLISLVSVASNYLLLQTESSAEFIITFERITTIIETFHMEKFAFNGVAGFFLTAAHGFALQQNKDQCLSALEQYGKFVYEISYPLKLHGDDYFNQVDGWIENTLDLGSSAPRDEKTIRESFALAIEGNPVFELLRDDIRYINVLRKVGQ